MAKIEFPNQLKQLLDSEDSDLHAPIRALADRVGEILADNKLPFFPDYTDHGTDHINSVLKSEVELVPKYVWEQSKKDSAPRLLCDADAAVMIGATLLHDIAMHLRIDGFLELISKESRFIPLPWFKERHEGHTADRPWHELWENYAREARRFNDRTLGNIIGLESSRRWKFQDLPSDAGQWERNHFLIAGEFLRRHHARLAHEIAIYGFPGLPVGSALNQFPAMGQEVGHPLMRLADLIGLTARSHGTSLRICQTYIDANPSYQGTPRPMGTAVLYPMALMRVADYFQIDRQRAPAVLLQLRDPQSPISVQEWKKHLAVQSISPATDPRGKMVTVSTSLTLQLYLQLHELLEGLQKEMDQSTAVLDEAYGARSDIGLNQLSLATRRVYSNLDSPAFRDSLPYVPERTGFAADPNLLTLLVEPLYGKEPSVGVRELLQNAVDAVCELETWCEAHGSSTVSRDLPKQEADVLIDFIKRNDGTWFLRVQDKGIGMRSETIQNYFLRAGASFRQSADWEKEFLDDKGRSRVLRSGRFGVGAFAIFLLGASFRLWTRHAAADKSSGYTLEASADSHLIEIHRVDNLPVGTKIEVDLTSASVAKLELDEQKYQDYSGPKNKIDWFCWDWPTVIKRVIRGPEPEILEPEFAASLRKDKPGPEWSLIRPTGFDSVYWTFGNERTLACNGLAISEPGFFLDDRGFGWPEDVQLICPCIAVLDSAANLPLTTQRYRLSQDTVPFISELTRDVTLSFIAHALICGPETRKDALQSECRHPLSLKQFSTVRERNISNSSQNNSLLSDGLLRWCTTPTQIIPADPWLYSLLGEDSCFVWGIFDLDFYHCGSRILPSMAPEQAEVRDCAMLNWHFGAEFHESDRKELPFKFTRIPSLILTELAQNGVKALGHELDSSQVVVSVSADFQYGTDRPAWERRCPWTMAEIWQGTNKDDAERLHFKAQTGAITSAIQLEPLLADMEGAMAGRKTRHHYHYDDDIPDVLFVAELKTKKVSRSPESLIARVWNECLGPKAIPFDHAARQALIDQGRKHPDLKIHIEAWEELKRTGSEWVKGRRL